MHVMLPAVDDLTLNITSSMLDNPSWEMVTETPPVTYVPKLTSVIDIQ